MVSVDQFDESSARVTAVEVGIEDDFESLGAQVPLRAGPFRSVLDGEGELVCTAIVGGHKLQVEPGLKSLREIDPFAKPGRAKLTVRIRRETQAVDVAGQGNIRKIIDDPSIAKQTEFIPCEVKILVADSPDGRCHDSGGELLGDTTRRAGGGHSVGRIEGWHYAYRSVCHYRPDPLINGDARRPAGCPSQDERFVGDEKWSVANELRNHRQQRTGIRHRDRGRCRAAGQTRIDSDIFAGVCAVPGDVVD